MPPAGTAKLSVPVEVTSSTKDATWQGNLLFRFEAVGPKAGGEAARSLEIFALRLVPSGGDKNAAAAIGLDLGRNPEGKFSVTFNNGIEGGLAGVVPTDPVRRQLATLEASVRTPHHYTVWPTSAAEPPSIVLANSSDDAIAGTLSWTQEGFMGGVLAPVQRRVDVPAGESVSVSLPRPTRQDAYLVRAAFRPDGSEQARDWVLHYAALDPAGPTPYRTTGDDFLFGLANGATIRRDNDETQKYIEVSALVGAKYLRMTRHWPQIEPRQGEFDWDRMDFIVQTAWDNFIEIQPVAGNPPGWAVRPEYRDHKTPGRTTPQLEPFKAYLQTFARRYAGRVRHFEIYNEPDIDFYIGTIEEYMGLLKASHEALREVDPDIRVLTGGFTGFVHPRRKPGFQETVLRDGQAYFDLHTLHMHGVFDRFWGGLNNLVVRFRDSAGVQQPMIFNETGMDARHGWRYQAEVLPKKVAATRAHGARGYVWYSILDKNRKPEDRYKPGRSYGLITDDGQAKPALLAYNTAAKLIASPHSTFVEHWDLGGQRFAFVFRRPDGAYVTLAWTERGEQAEALLAVTLAEEPQNPGEGQATIIDLVGNTSPAGRFGESVVLPLGWSPVYLVTAARPAPGALLLEPNAVLPGDVKATVHVSNGTGAWQLAGTSVATGTGQATVALPLDVRPPVPTFNDPTTTGIATGSVSYDVGGGVSGVLQVPAEVAVTLR
ncbi:MAG: hypothetical protein ACFCVE_10140, partial [Phycisphaerae bacterium]